MSPAEAAAVVLAIAYLLLAIRQNVLCWPSAIASAGIFAVLFFRAGLFMQALLQVFYIAMSLYGWQTWSRGDSGRALPVTRWPLRAHLAPVALILLLGLANGYLLSVHGGDALPYLDAVLAWGAIVTTWLVARKVLENWHYWFVIDALSIYLYASQGLWLTAGLFGLYLVLIVVGYREWRGSMERAGA